MKSLFCGFEASGQLVQTKAIRITNGTHGNQRHQLASPMASKDTTDINNVEPQDVDG